MNENSLLEFRGQDSATDTGQVFRDFLRGHVGKMICEVMAAEVTKHCGPEHVPYSDDYYRTGSATRRVLYEGEWEDVKRPRVR